MYKEQIGDVFELYDKGYCIAHCISADYALGAGIALEIHRRFNTRNHLMNEMYLNSSGMTDNLKPQWDNTVIGDRGTCVFCRGIYNLVTKRNSWDKPTYEALKNSLVSMKELAINKFNFGERVYSDENGVHNINKIAMPTIGCGLDRLNWSIVSDILEVMFSDDVNFDIVVCKLKENY